MSLGVGLYSSFDEQHAAHRRAGCPTCARDVDTARLVRTVESVQADIAEQFGLRYDRQSWEIYVGHQMQRILDVLAPAEETPAEALNHAIHDATGYKPAEDR
jgi:hypothetical protein